MMLKRRSTFVSEGSLTRYLVFSVVLTVLCCFFPLYEASAQRAPIDVNLIIDGSQAFSGSREEITTWVCSRLDEILADGDRVTLWNAGTAARVVYSGSISSAADREAVKKSVRDFSASGNRADFSGALREAANRQGSSYSYTLLVSASPDALTSVLTSPQANLLRFSRVEEFSTWRALVVGLDLDTKVRRAAAAYLGS
ncbi:MAG: hypothetical protein LBU66_07445 [Treponema sp.]|jgi:hypothetical protein|nr:hypothetical protein [Treponema sp.]